MTDDTEPIAHDNPDDAPTDGDTTVGAPDPKEVPNDTVEEDA